MQRTFLACLGLLDRLWSSTALRAAWGLVASSAASSPRRRSSPYPVVIMGAPWQIIGG